MWLMGSISIAKTVMIVSILAQTNAHVKVKETLVHAY